MSNLITRCKRFARGGVRIFGYWVLVSKNFGRVLSDRTYLKWHYYLRTGEKLDLTNPKGFNEKLQWLKLYDRKPEYVTMVDKYEAKRYVAGILGEQYIIPTLGVWNHFDDINFDELPNQFVLKCSHDSGSIIICRDKNKLDIAAAKKKLEKALKKNAYWYSREWPYKTVQRKIIAEQYMEDASGKSLKDYKFYCFNGEPKFLYLSEGLENHATAHISYVTLDWKKAPFVRNDYRPFDVLPAKPVNFEKMCEFARLLSKDIPFVRIDFYEINGDLYFGEITFFPAGGYAPFEPAEWDIKVGKWIQLPNREIQERE